MKTLADVETPRLTHGGRRLNGDFEALDRFTRETGVTATIFARKGDAEAGTDMSEMSKDSAEASEMPVRREQSAL